MSLEDLTKKEFEILELMAKGKSYKEIAEELTISTHTVNTHASHIFEKLGVKRIKAVALYWENKNEKICD